VRRTAGGQSASRTAANCRLIKRAGRRSAAPGICLAAMGPLTVLGLVKLVESRGWNWRASDDEITEVLGKFGWSPGPAAT
jgi:hypothetical protein